MKHLNLNLNKTLLPNSNIVLSSQQAIKSYIDSKKVFIQFLQESAPTIFKAGDKWVNTTSNKLFIATNDTTWDDGSDLDIMAIYSFGNLLYHYNGTDTKCYSTTSITEQNANKEIKEWFGTQDEYNAIEAKDENTHYIIIDDTSTSSSLLATQEEFNNSVTDKAATPKQVNEKIGNYLPLAGGNLDKGAILRFTNTNNQVSSMSLDENKYITMSDNLKVSGDINTNSLVSTTGNIYKGNSSGATNIWSDSFATTEKAGIIKIGENLTVAEDGTLNAAAADVTSVNGKTGDVQLTADDLGAAKQTDLDKYLPLIGGDMGQNLFTYNYENNKVYYYWNKLFNIVDLPVNSWSIFLIVCKRDFNSVYSYSSLLYVSRYSQNNSYSIILTPISAFSNNTDESNICVATDTDKNVYVQGRPSWGGTQNGAFKIVKLVGSVNFTPENAGQANFGEAPTGVTFLSKIDDGGAYRVSLADNSVTNYEDSANLLKFTAKYAINDSKGNDISTTYIKVAQKGVANGVASLDTNAKLPESQLPDAVAYQTILREW